MANHRVRGVLLWVLSGWLYDSPADDTDGTAEEDNVPHGFQREDGHPVAAKTARQAAS
jgi:hypothetical protein